MKNRSKGKINIILRAVLIVVISLAIGFGVYNLNAKNLMGNAMPMPFGVGVAVVLSGSMEPELSVDDMIMVIAQDSYSVGDVVVYQSRSSLVVHKIIGIDGDTVTTQGTANNAPDEPINISLIKGKVAFSIKGIGKLIHFVKSPVVTVAIIVIAFLLLIFSYRKENEDEQKKLDEIREQIKMLKKEQSDGGEED